MLQASDFLSSTTITIICSAETVETNIQAQIFVGRDVLLCVFFSYMFDFLSVFDFASVHVVQHVFHFHLNKVNIFCLLFCFPWMSHSSL